MIERFARMKQDHQVTIDNDRQWLHMFSRICLAPVWIMLLTGIYFYSTQVINSSEPLNYIMQTLIPFRIKYLELMISQFHVAQGLPRALNLLYINIMSYQVSVSKTRTYCSRVIIFVQQLSTIVIFNSTGIKCMLLYAICGQFRSISSLCQTDSHRRVELKR